MSEIVNPQSPRPSARDRTAAVLTQAAQAQLQDGGEMTVAAVAARAGVSRATAYRYFVNNDAVTLWAAMPALADVAASDDAAETRGQLTERADPTPADRAEHLVRARGEWAFEHVRELRALLATSLAPGSQEAGTFRQGKMRRQEWIEASLLRYLPSNVSDNQRRRLALALTPLFGSDMVVWTADAAELAEDQALELIAWIARTLVEATLAEAPATRKRSQRRRQV
jgi:AcrR family transcriptional regulator